MGEKESLKGKIKKNARRVESKREKEIKLKERENTERLKVAVNLEKSNEKTIV